MKYFFSKLLLALTMLSSMTVMAEPVHIRFWSAYAPGGPNDQQIRILQRYLQEQNPEFVITVEYKIGAGGTVGLNHFAKLDKSIDKSNQVDILLEAFGILVRKYMTKTNTVDLNKDIEILMPLGNTQMLILVPESSPVNSLDDLKKSKKDSLSYGSAGLGSTGHLTSAYLENYINKKMIHVPYKGSAPVFQDLIAGRLDLFSVLYSGGIEQVIGNKVKAIGITGSVRNARLPNVKTLEEQGLKNYPIDPWYALFVHPKNDPVQQRRVQQALLKILQDPAIQKNYQLEGISIDNAGLKDPKAWLDRQDKLFQNLARDPRLADLESK
jgi:tripartite-type tricarboxylate transporter receptor subunit TctC